MLTEAEIDALLKGWPLPPRTCSHKYIWVPGLGERCYFCNLPAT